MKKPAAEAVAAAEITATAKSATAAKGCRNLVSLRCSLLRSSPHHGNRQSTEIMRKAKREKIWFQSLCGGHDPRDKNVARNGFHTNGPTSFRPVCGIPSRGAPRTVVGRPTGSVWLDQGWVGCVVEFFLF
jgi:hypothetical protein